jgi:hypothetical protein
MYNNWEKLLHFYGINMTLSTLKHLINLLFVFSKDAEELFKVTN